MGTEYWKSATRVLSLLLAAAFGPLAVADGPPPTTVASARSPSQPASQIASTDPGSDDPSPFHSLVLSSTLSESNGAATEAPATGSVAPTSSPTNSWIPTCICDGMGSGCTFQWAPDKWCNISVGVRASFNHQTGTGITDENFFAVNNVRVFLNGKVTQIIGFEVNTDISGASDKGFTDSSSDLLDLQDSIHLLDAIVKFGFNDYVNVWAGRFLVPNDRQDLDGPFFLNGWEFPFVSNYPSQYLGRDTGVAYWGQYGEGKLKWQMGLFNGQGRISGGNDWPIAPPEISPNVTGNPEFVARVVANLLDPEPGYYNRSTYYGEKDIAALGLSVTDQTDALEDANGRVGTFFAWNVDFLFENKMTEWGSGTLEGAFYRYDVGGGVRNDIAGTSGFLFAGWLLPRQIGCGSVCGYLRPYVRWQRYDYADEQIAAENLDFKEGWDIGFQYVMKGPNARMDFYYGQREVEGGGNVNLFRTGVQLIF
jgi:hypothetical protein